MGIGGYFVVQFRESLIELGFFDYVGNIKMLFDRI